MNLTPASIPELQDLLKTHMHFLPKGGGSKPALLSSNRGAVLEMSALSGIVEYDPAEFTITAWAGTPLTQITDVLAEQGQYLPFDPPLQTRGATLGGTVAAGLSGPGRYRFGGVRDFLLGVSFIDAAGREVTSGAKVVKNAAGFGLERLLVGSMGRLGVITQATFKVFPLPQAFASWRLQMSSLQEALAALVRLRASPLELWGLEVTPDLVLWARVAGSLEVIMPQAERVWKLMGEKGEIVEKEEAEFWLAAREFSWVPQGHGLVRVPIGLRQLPALDSSLRAQGVLAHYSAGGSLAWVDWPPSARPDALVMLLQSLALTGQPLFGPFYQPQIGNIETNALYNRVKSVLDPLDKLG